MTQPLTAAPMNIDPTPPARGWSLFIRVATFVFVTAATTVAVLTGTSYLAAHSIIRQQVEQRLHVAATQRAQAIEMFVGQQHERARLIASRTRLRERMRAWSRDELPTEAFRADVSRILSDAMTSSDEFVEISIADPQGQVIASTNAARIGVDLAAEPAFQAGRTHAYLSEFTFVHDQLLTTLTAPAFDEQQRLLGVVVVTLNAKSLTRIVTDPTGLGESGEVLIGRPKGEDRIHYLLPSRLTQQTEIERAKAPSMVKAMQGQYGFERAQYNEQQVLVFYQPVAYQPHDRLWGVVVKLTAEEAFTPLLNLRRIVLPLGFVLLVPPIVSAYWLANRYARPIMQLAASAEIIADGHLAHRVLEVHDGEIGVLSRAFNDMAARLEASYEVLEKRVAERTNALSAANQELERSNRDLEQFAYVASHDIQEPLRAITGFAKLLRDQSREQLSPNNKEYLQLILEGADRMKLLIDNLLEYSLVRSHGAALVEVDGQAALEHSLQNLRATLEQRGAIVTHEGLGRVLADRLQLSQVFQNLIGNAIKFCQQPVPRVHVKGQQQGDELLISVHDNGIGVDPKDYQRIFTIFQRLHIREDYEGTGLGLAICQQIVQRHGGRIWVESKVGEGSTFFFTLRCPTDRA